MRQVRLEGALPSNCPGPNWCSAQASALEAITRRTGAPGAAGRVGGGAPQPYSSPPLSCLSSLTAGSGSIPDRNIFGYMKYSLFLPPFYRFTYIYSPELFYFLIPCVTSLEKMLREEGTPSTKGQGIRGADNQNQGLFLI